MILGYQKQRQFLKKSAELGKIPHAFLFCGNGSFGGKTIALEFIRLLNCQDQNFSARPCNICRSCRDIQKKTDPDLFIIEPQGKEIQIAQIKALSLKLALRAYSARFKSIIIDRAHCLNQEAQSAFLKTLEEPKGSTLFILVTEYPELLLPTILSRVESLKFYSLPAKFEADDSYQKRIIAEVLQISRQDLALRFQYVKELSAGNQDLKKILDIWLRYFRELLLSAVHNQPKESKEYSLAKLMRILRTIQTTNFLISTTSVNPRLALEILMLEL